MTVQDFQQFETPGSRYKLVNNREQVIIRWLRPQEADVTDRCIFFGNKIGALTLSITSCALCPDAQ